MLAHAGPVQASGALPAHMDSVLEDFFCPDTGDDTISEAVIIKKRAQKAGRRSKAGVNVPRLKQAVDQGMLNDDDGLTLVEDMDKLEDMPVPTKIQHLVPSAPQKTKEIP